MEYDPDLQFRDATGVVLLAPDGPWEYDPVEFDALAAWYPWDTPWAPADLPWGWDIGSMPYNWRWRLVCFRMYMHDLADYFAFRLLEAS